ncbi:MAG: ATP-binding cassette domain-containing protein [Deltaproteobacteria bacterium]|nr:ATP-binding cassette domain-containing protein [Deltaproteobacteria bacterium]MBW2445686.1 ATP-binding cassette domain-containing protein [Deltaproteobacteria bacterium]
MPLLRLDDVSISFGRHALLDQAGLQIDAGERVCLIGRNGAGKSTLLKIVDGGVAPDAGEVWRQPGLVIARLSQDLPADGDATVFDVVAAGLAEVGHLLAEYHHTAHAVAEDASLLKRMDTLQHEIEACDGWALNQRVEQMLGRLDLPADTRIDELSGGWRRRVSLAQALVSDPDLLLLDEPTNHLDIEVIQWLEEQLLELRGGVLFVTHDRALLTRLATRIVELDRGVLTSWAGDYPTFLKKKAAALDEEARHAALFDKKLAQEEAWIRQGIKARRTRNEGRVRALFALREERAARRDPEGKVRLALDEGRTSGKLVAEAKDVSFTWPGGEAPIVRDLSMRIMRRDRIGLVGPNGVGKTTLLQLLLGQLAPSSGSVRLGTKLEIAHFDQLRAGLDLDKSVVENLGEGREYIEVRGESRHVIGYLQDFLFSPDRARTPMRALSGGEHSRVLLARLFAQPANLLVLDEPTNDLDMETLELLEELLTDYSGTVLLVSHDRAFLDNVVTSTLVFEGGGVVQEYVGGYSDWLRRRAASEAAATKQAKASRPAPAPKSKPAKLGFMAARELAETPAKIEALEAEQSELVGSLSEPAFYENDAAHQARVHSRIAELTVELEAAYTRWAELEALNPIKS